MGMLIDASPFRELNFPSLDEDPEELLKRISSAKIFEYDGKNNLDAFPSKIQKNFRKVANLKIGQNLLSFFIAHTQDHRLSFELTTEGSGFCFRERKISLLIGAFAIFKSGDSYINLPSKITFIHELLHYKHFIENPKKFLEMSFPIETHDLINPEMDDPEEQITICGINALEKNAEIVLCENHFRRAWNLPLRFTHQGIKDPKCAIERDVSIDYDLFLKLFKRYWNHIPEHCFRKTALVVNIDCPTPNQAELIQKVSSVVKVYNLAQIPDEKTREAIKVSELWDIDFT